MQIKNIFTVLLVTSSISLSAFIAYKIGKENKPIDHAKELQSEIARLQLEVKSKKLSTRDQYVLNAINGYGINIHSLGT